MIRILINGEVYITNFAISIYDLLNFLIPNGYEVIVEYNHKIVHYENYQTIQLRNYDKLELITIVGGG